MTRVPTSTVHDEFDSIERFWSDQINNEIYLKGHEEISRGSQEYFDLIMAKRLQYIYYLPDVEKHFGPAAPGQKLLEVGCGIGMDLVGFARLGYQVTGIDLATEHIAIARKCLDTYGVAGNVSVGNAEHLDFEDDSFDRVHSYGVLHHTPHTDRAIREIHRVLRPGGRAFLMLYHRYSLNNLLHLILRVPFENPKKSTTVTADAPFTHRFSKTEVVQMCRDFSRISIKTEYVYGAGYGRVYEYTPSSVYRWLSKIAGWHLAIYLQK